MTAHVRGSILNVRGAMLIVTLTAAGFPATAVAQARFVVDAHSAAGDAEIAALRAEYAAAASAGDASRLSALYAADAIAVPRDGVMLRGRAEIERYTDEAFTTVADGATVMLMPRHFESRGHVASETGTFSETRQGEGQPAATGVYVAIYTRGSDGVWRIAMEVRSRGRDRQAVKW